MDTTNQNFNGVLFGSVNYKSPEDIIKLIDSLESPQAFYMITKALEYAHTNGLYSLEESEIISKSLRLVNQQLTK